ncbi:gustatory and odorant receptor 24-like [Frankliniella occidentalis]|uniref:Gustatory receptor n=1 Tax=Frankliniella occidentalis TaxID=133901 RepID=A0A9C6X0B2_FRAOC|nr:gustatory and odorant receptor 24-like [Frankliniella occidentalis]
MSAYPSDYPGPPPGAGLRVLDRAQQAVQDADDKDGKAAAAAPEDDVCYHSLRPIWLAMQVLGFYPMHRLCRGRRPREPSLWLGLSTLQFGAVVACMGLAVAEVRGRADEDQDFDGVVIDYLVYMQCALPLAVLPLYASHRSAMAQYLRDWGALQADFAREFGRSLSSCRGFGPRPSWEMVTIVGVFSLLVAGAQALLNPAIVVLALVHSTLVSALLTSSFYLHGRLLRAASRALADHLALELRRPVPRVAAVDNIRLLVLRVVALGGGLSSAVAMPLGLLLLAHFILATLTLYAVLGQVSYTYAARLPSLGTGTALSGLLLYLACDTGHRVARAVKQLAVEELLAFHKRTTVIGADLRKMAKTFISTVQEVPSDVSLSGVTTLNRGLFTAMLSTMVTYLVVIVQFRISLEQAGSDKGARPGTANSSTTLPGNDSAIEPTTTTTTTLTWSGEGSASPSPPTTVVDNTTLSV